MKKQFKIIKLLKLTLAQTDWSKYHPANWDRMKFVYPFQMMTHPIETCNDIKYEKRGSLALANIIAFLFFILRLLTATSTGFIFNINSGDKINVWAILLSTIGLILLWCVSGWSLSTLMDGEGRFGDIYILTCYSMIPEVLFRLPLILMSNIIIIEEYGLITILEIIITGWCYLLLFLSTMVVQQYTVLKTVMMCIFTVIGIMAILFLAVLLFSLFQQFYIFIKTVAAEAMFRL